MEVCTLSVANYLDNDSIGNSQGDSEEEKYKNFQDEVFYHRLVIERIKEWLSLGSKAKSLMRAHVQIYIKDGCYQNKTEKQHKDWVKLKNRN